MPCPTATGLKPIPWVRVFKVPEYVQYTHKQHVQAGLQCQTCHGSSETWKLPGYKHQGKNMVEFFAAKHGTVPCADCHKEKSETFPAGPGTAVVFKGTPMLMHYVTSKSAVLSMTRCMARELGGARQTDSRPHLSDALGRRVVKVFFESGEPRGLVRRLA